MAHEGNRTIAALIAETAFELLASGSGNWSEVENRVGTYLEGLDGTEGHPKLTSGARLEVAHLRDSLANYIGSELAAATFRPSIPGCGVVEPAQGDILIGSRLVEVKTVQRTFRGIDFRQALTYSALLYSGGLNVGIISLVNPRLGLSYTASAEDLALDIGAGSWVQLMQDLVEVMTETGVSL